MQRFRNFLKNSIFQEHELLFNFNESIMTLQSLVAKYDPDNLFDVLLNTWDQVLYAWNNHIDVSAIDMAGIKNIIISGLGGSAISADFLRNFLKDELRYPLQVNRNYSLPVYADKETLVIVSSYSGNTEETISVLEDAINRGCRIICITTGGKIGEIAKANRLPLITLKSGYQPRYSFGLSFFSVLKVFQTLKLCGNYDDFTQRIIKMWKLRGEELALENNEALVLAEKISGHIPLIISVSDYTDSIGMRMKTQFNENSKIHSFHTPLPEHNHNEIIGWESYREDQLNAATIIIDDPSYHPQVKKRLDLVEGIIQKMNCPVYRIKSEETIFGERLLDMIYFADWVTYYLAIVRGKDPAEIDNIHYLKAQLAK